MHMRLGCQTITFRNADPAWPLSETLEAVADAGFEGVELAAQSLDLTAPERLRAEMAAHGLRIAGLHLPGGNFDRQAQPKTRVDLDGLRACVEACEVPFVLCSGPAGRSGEDLGRLLSEAGRALAASGATLCYHNHGREIDDDAAWLATFCAASDPEAVGLGFDLGWAHRVGADPAAIVRRFASRIRYVHVKDTDGEGWTELGRGRVDLPAVLTAVEELHLPWWVAEQDRCAGDPAASVRLSAAYLRAWRDRGAAR